MPPILTKTEREFIEDWFRVIEGEISLLEFYTKWSSTKRGERFADDLEKLERGEIDIEEFRRKWSRKADWKIRIRKLRHDIKKKYELAKEELKLIEKFLDLEKQP